MEANRFVRLGALRRLDGVAARCADWLLSERRCLAALFLYVLVLYLIKGHLYLGAIGHDVDPLVLGQTLQLGYDNRNPPLYPWLVIGAQAVFGVGLGAVLAVKSALIFALYLLLYLSARRVLGDRPLTLLSALAPFAMYEVGLWLAIKYSHTAALAVACAATFYVLLRLEDSGRTRWYGILGAVLGLGLLAKYNYAIFLVAMIAACLFDPGLRARLGDRRILLSLAVALILIAPHAYWMLAQAPGYEAAATSRFGMGSSAPRLERLAIGALAGLRAILNMLLPLAVAIPFLAWRRWRRGVSADWPSRRHFRLLGIYLLMCALSVFVLVAASGAVKVRGHYLFVFVLFPIWLMAWIQGLGLSRTALNRIGLAFIALALITPAVMVSKFLTHPLGDHYVRYNLPYETLAEHLRDAGFQSGTIYAHDFPYSLSGNLRPYFPEARILGTNTPYFVPPERAGAGSCLLIWTVDRKSSVDGRMTRAAQDLFGFQGIEGSALLQAGVEVALGRGRSVWFRYRLFPDGAGSCH